MTGPIQSNFDPRSELEKMQEEIDKYTREVEKEMDKMKPSASGEIDPAGMKNLQGELQKLVNNPNIPQNVKDHINTLMQNFARDPTHVNAEDLAIVQKDLKNLR